jgi:hypothetical protein
MWFAMEQPERRVVADHTEVCELRRISRTNVSQDAYVRHPRNCLCNRDKGPHLVRIGVCHRDGVGATGFRTSRYNRSGWTVSRTAQLFCTSELRAEPVGNYAPPWEKFAGSVCEERCSIRSRVIFRANN